MLKLGAGVRVRLKGKTRALGAVAATGPNKGSWLVSWDAGGNKEHTARQLAVELPDTAISPASKAAFKRKAPEHTTGLELDDNEPGSESDDSGSGGDDGSSGGARVRQDDENSHVVRRQQYTDVFKGFADAGEKHTVITRAALGSASFGVDSHPALTQRW
jgi:hypothetical protein